jgi:hypothetical protein
MADSFKDHIKEISSENRVHSSELHEQNLSLSKKTHNPYFPSKFERLAEIERTNIQIGDIFMFVIFIKIDFS